MASEANGPEQLDLWCEGQDAERPVYFLRLTQALKTQLCGAARDHEQPNITMTLGKPGVAPKLVVNGVAHQVKTIEEKDPTLYNCCAESTSGRYMEEIGSGIKAKLHVQAGFEASRANANRVKSQIADKKLAHSTVEVGAKPLATASAPAKKSPVKRKLASVTRPSPSPASKPAPTVKKSRVSPPPNPTRTVHSEKITTSSSSSRSAPPPAASATWAPPASSGVHPDDMSNKVIELLRTRERGMRQRALVEAIENADAKSIEQILSKVAIPQPTGAYVLKKEFFHAKAAPKPTSKRPARPPSTSSKPTVDVEALKKKWKPINAEKEYDKYTEHFKRKYEEYSDLHKKIKENSSDFQKINQLRTRSTGEAQTKAQREMQELYNKRKPDVQRWLHAYRNLHEELKIIKQRVTDFVNKQ